MADSWIDDLHLSGVDVRPTPMTLVVVGATNA